MLAPMPGGKREERLRAWVNRRLKIRGTGAALARHLKRPSSWMTNYSTGARDADLDTAIEIGRFFQVPLPIIVGEEPLPEHDAATSLSASVLKGLRAMGDRKSVV